MYSASGVRRENRSHPFGEQRQKKCNNADNWFNNSCRMLTSNIETRQKSLWLIFKVIIGVTNNNMDEEGAVNLQYLNTTQPRADQFPQCNIPHFLPNGMQRLKIRGNKNRSLVEITFSDGVVGTVQCVCNVSELQ